MVVDADESEEVNMSVAPGWSKGIQSDASGDVPEGMCVECEDQPIQVRPMTALWYRCVLFKTCLMNSYV